MIFNLKLNAVKGIKKYQLNSAMLVFCKTNTEFERKLKSLNVKVSKLQKSKFRDDKNGEIKIWQLSSPELIIIKKVDSSKQISNDYFRDYFAGLIQFFETVDVKHLYIDAPKLADSKIGIENEKYFYQSIVEGIYLGNYNFNKFKADKKKVKSLSIHFVSPILTKIISAILKGSLISKSVYFSRDLVNEPANILTPQELANRVKKEFSRTKVKVKVFDEKELAKRKMNAILSVGKGSENKPRLITATYKPTGKIKKKIALVGKGVTYDTGGLSIKPTDGMIDMKADMAGSATAFGIIKAAAMAKLPVEIMVVVPAVENAISGNAYKPGDIISTASGKTIEVKNTDAEGRIVLADALEFASKQKPDQIIDFATLTGAVVVALGELTAGIFSKNDTMAEGLYNSGQQTFERVWRLPFWDEYNKLIESKIADVSNLGPRWGGAITAGKFLEHFVDEKIPWTHIDIAGTATKNDSTNYTKKYCTGFGVRLIFDYLEKL
ncbi:MAG: leucyl aminopeptidase [Ignavibacteriae bacterium]|nr:leucyl aminopeptidase [Ignavibacteriota bacterium]